MGQETWSNKKWLDEQLARGIELPNVDVLNSSTIDVSATASVGSLVISNTASIPTDTSTDLNYLTVDNNGNVGKKPKKNVKKIFTGVLHADAISQTIAIIENTTGVTPTSSRIGVGDYTVTFSGLSVSNMDKVFWTYPNPKGEEANNYTSSAYVDNFGGNLVFNIKTFDAGVASDVVIDWAGYGTPIRIEIYE